MVADIYTQVDSRKLEQILWFAQMKQSDSSRKLSIQENKNTIVSTCEIQVEWHDDC